MPFYQKIPVGARNKRNTSWLAAIICIPIQVQCWNIPQRHAVIANHRLRRHIKNTMPPRIRGKGRGNNKWSSFSLEGLKDVEDGSNIEQTTSISTLRKKEAPPKKDAPYFGGDIVLNSLEEENHLLHEQIRQLQTENEIYKQRQRIVIETFEGEEQLQQMQNSADECIIGDDGVVDENSCPIEPTISFGDALRDRAVWLVGLLMAQSGSGIILSKNEALLADHPVIIFFLTMLVGAGGNAGNQASVRVIRGLALGTLNEKLRINF